MVGTQLASVIVGQKKPQDALKDMQTQATKIMTKGGYYRS
jgi:ABC-type glycerol-3-phosphate transport system substrate-binding protein